MVRFVEIITKTYNIRTQSSFMFNFLFFSSRKHINITLLILYCLDFETKIPDERSFNGLWFFYLFILITIFQPQKF